MNIIRLPATLPGDLDLAAVNQQLRESTAQLDWGEVTSAPQDQLEILLKGLNLSDHAEEIGIYEFIPEGIEVEISNYFESRKKSKKRVPVSKRKTEPPQPIPDTSGPESEPDKTRKRKKVIEVPKPLAELIPSAPQIRDELEKLVLKELMGTAGGEEEEVDEQKLSDRYIIGMLAPQHRWIGPSPVSNEEEEELQSEFLEQQDSLELAGAGNDEDGTADSNAPPPIETMTPSSFGMTFCVAAGTSSIQIRASWGQYHRVDSETAKTEKDNPKKVWKRTPIEGTSPPIPLRIGKINPWVIHPEYPEVVVQGQMRQQGQDGDWIISLFLVNGQREPGKSKDRTWLFQPELQVESGDPQTPAIFIRRYQSKQARSLDPVTFAEEQAMAMLYRKHLEFAVGHGVSVHAEPSAEGPEKAVRLSTVIAPTYEVPQTTPPGASEIPKLSGLVLDMKELANCSAEALLTNLQPLVTAYEDWIQHQESRIQDPQENLQHFQDSAETAITRCKQALSRIQEGLHYLENNTQAVEAFQFMNRAMWQQRIRSIFAESTRRGETPDLETIDIPKNRSWRVFQIAFILLNLPSLTNLHHPERSDLKESVADLLWFPTGGGKTEAYLGLTAYTLGLRRLQGKVAGRSGEYGMAVLMRYTLRLLTLQQFQRATTLICACESIRREDPKKWGNEPFRIGLWVGQRTTPNHTDQSEEFIKQSRGQHQQGFGGGSPHQLMNCPWCGTQIEPGKHIHVETYQKGRCRTLVYCGDSLGQCLFSEKYSKGEGLPIVVVDEEIYRRLPSLLIATVDKFAQMPWKGEVQMLFGQVNGICERHGFRSPDLEDKDSHPAKYGLPRAKTAPSNPIRPPDLIIQDELHLISGPLGTLVGLYETAIDQLSSWEVDGKVVRPKVIASTATIRQAEAQIHNLFLRKLQIFPPQGLDAADNFFSRQRQPSEQTPGRRYLGICAPGRRLKSTLIRVYLAMLSASQSLYEKYGTAADPWMTLVGYFNSIRELGGTRRLIDDDIRSRLSYMDTRGLATRRNLQIEELTSRRSSTEIPRILDRLEIKFDPQHLAENQARRRASEKIERPDPLDVLLATNMISVGVDVSRFGAMVVTGQPKNTAEYIQATSRVGRRYPGLVLTVYNWARPRDLSHYERFEHYHATFYQHVEALSLTPFAPRAVDRGLSALLVSLIRLSGLEFNSNEAAGRIQRNHPLVQRALDVIEERASLVSDAPSGARVRQQLEAKLDTWLSTAQGLIGGGELKYRSEKRDGITIELLKSAGKGNWEDFTCLNSLRNVEPTVGLILNDQAPDDDFSRTPQPYSPNERG